MWLDKYKFFVGGHVLVKVGVTVLVFILIASGIYIVWYNIPMSYYNKGTTDKRAASLRGAHTKGITYTGISALVFIQQHAYICTV